MMNESLKRSEQTADDVRQGLLATLRELERRKEHALDIRSYTLWLWVAGAVGTLLLGVWAVRRKVRGPRKNRARVKGFIRAWDHPESVARQPSYPVQLAQKMGLAGAGAFANRLVRNF